MKEARLSTIGATVMLIIYLVLSLVVICATELGFISSDIISQTWLKFFQLSLTKVLGVFYSSLFILLFVLELSNFREPAE
ncbi:MAG: hypothetical protein WC467_00400 [Patescibacteria group bacterium]